MSSVDEAKKRILAKVPLDKLIGDSIKPQRRSGRIMGLCPFHAEKTPSFYIFDDHYHCFGCGAHGDAISYVQHEQGLGFIDALKYLASKFSVDAPELERSRIDRKEWGEKAGLSRMMAAAQNFFVENLNSAAGQNARHYLEKRGFSEEAIKEIGFGYAPMGRQNLVNHLKRLGYQPAMMTQGSLANHYDGQTVDFFRNRVMVPIRDLHGRLIAFGGRALGDEPQKYKNSRYDKGLVLFGLDKARKTMRSKARAIVVEGYLDCLMLWQKGFPETVACQGTALTSHHMRSLKSATGMVFLLFDGDQAGRAASLKLVSDALEVPEIQFKVALLPEGEDPDSYVRKHGEEELELLLRRSQDLVDYAISQKLKGVHAAALPDLINREFIPWLSKIDDLVKKSFLVSRLAQSTGINEKTLIHQLSNPNYSAKIKTVTEAPKHQKVKLAKGYDDFLAHLFYAEPGEIDIEAIKEYLAKNSQLSDKWMILAQHLIQTLIAGKAPRSEDHSLWEVSSDMEITEFIDHIRQSPSKYQSKNRMDSLRQLWLSLRKQELIAQRSKLKSQVATLDLNQPENEEHWRQLAKAITLLNKELDLIDKRM